MMMKVHFTVLTIVLILGNTTMQIDAEGGFCDNKCGVRCSKAGMKDRCLRYCGICCRECNCVPSSTYGNRHECPCYGYNKNSKGNPKCP